MVAATKPHRLTPPLKWHGGKTYLAPQIIALMAEHHHYVDLFGGGLAVLWAKSPLGVSEVVNDINAQLTSFYQVLQHEESFEKFRRRVEAIPFGRPQWEEAVRKLEEEPDANRVARAAWFFN